MEGAVENGYSGKTDVDDDGRIKRTGRFRRTGLPDTYLSGYYDKSLNSFCILQELFSLQVRTS